MIPDFQDLWKEVNTNSTEKTQMENNKSAKRKKDTNMGYWSYKAVECNEEMKEKNNKYFKVLTLSGRSYSWGIKDKGVSFITKEINICRGKLMDKRSEFEIELKKIKKEL